MRIIGIIIIVIGILMMVYTGFHYITSEKVVELGNLQINKETNHWVPWSPVVGVLLILGGAVILFQGKRK